MSLTAGMWTGVSGLMVHGDKMNIIGNNIANVNTLGFKGQRMDFADFMYDNSYSLSGVTQVGRGARIGDIMSDFGQGSYEASTEATDMAIGGRGFFKVKPIGQDTEYYTRAGNFRFNNNGYLTDPSGYVLQGWKIDNTTGPVRASGGLSPTLNQSQVLGTGVPTDVRLDTWTVEPLQTTQVSFNVNLSSSKGADKAKNPEKPFSSMMDVWDGSQPPRPNVPSIPDDAYSYQTSIKVFDEAGGTHTLTVYFDQVDSKSYSGANGERVWEYMVTMNPAEDLRKIAMPKYPTAYAAFLENPADTTNIYSPNYDPAVSGPKPTDFGTGYNVTDMSSTKDAGILMAGTLTFDSQGLLKNQSAYVLNGTNAPATQGTPPVVVAGNGYILDPDGNPVPILDPDHTEYAMKPTAVSSSGFPMIVANFTGVPGAETVGSVPDADKYLMEIDFGLKVSDYENPWNNNNAMSSLMYKKLASPMITPPVPPATEPTPWVNAYQPTPAPTPPNTLPMPSRDLSLGDVVRNQNPGGTPAYYYNNPDYKSSTPGSPPYVYSTKASYDAAYAAAEVNATARLGGAPGPGDIIKGDWPATDDATVPGPPAYTLLVAETPVAASDVANIKPPAYRQPNAFTSYSSDHQTKSMSQNGYGFGDLTNYTVDTNGVLYGIYSNGVNLPLYQVTLYDFTCKQGLRREGGNLFSETRESGQASSAAAGTSGFGSINANNLEGSNVDISKEFVQMITTQRGFQSNSKIITTVDTMLETVIQMKR